MSKDSQQVEMFHEKGHVKKIHQKSWKMLKIGLVWHMESFHVEIFHEKSHVKKFHQKSWKNAKNRLSRHIESFHDKRIHKKVCQKFCEKIKSHSISCQNFSWKMSCQKNSPKVVKKC